MNGRLRAPVEALLAGAAFAAWVLLGFAAMGEAIDLARAAAGLETGTVHWDAGTPAEMVGWFLAVAVVSASAATAHRLLWRCLGKTSLAVAALASIAALTSSVLDGSCWPFCEAVQLGGTEWLVAVLVSAGTGVLLGCAMVGPRLGCRSLWIPVAEIATGGAWLWLVLVPVMRLTVT